MPRTETSTSRSPFRRTRGLTIGMAVVAAAGLFAGAAAAAPAAASSTVTWTGNGTSVVEGSRMIDTTICGTASGAPVDGQYLLFILASTKSISSASITFGESSPVAMVKSNGTKRGTSSFRYVYTGPIDLAAMVGAVSATYAGSGTPTFTISHGCIETPTPGPSAVSKVLGSTFKYCVAGDCATFTSIVDPVDADRDDFIDVVFADIFNAYGMSPEPLLPPPTFDFTKVSAMSLHSADGTKITDLTPVMALIEGSTFLLGVVEDDTITPSALATTSGGAASADYAKVTYDGVVYLLPVFSAFEAG